MKSHGGITLQRCIFLLILIIFLIFCSGCRQQQLYTNLPENDINEMLAILLRNGISSEKTAGEDNAWNLNVDTDKFSDAIDILSRNGYPKESFSSLGEVFKKEGFISSPLEERIRFIYALSQEVSNTISKINGVIYAKVHVVLPENDPLSDNLIPSSASVFIKHHSRHRLDSSQIMKVKELVVNSIEGLEYKNVTVAMFPVEAPRKDFSTPKTYGFMGVQMSYESVNYLSKGIQIVSVFLFGALTTFAFHKFRAGTARANPTSENVQEDNPAQSPPNTVPHIDDEAGVPESYDNEFKI